MVKCCSIKDKSFFANSLKKKEQMKSFFDRENRSKNDEGLIKVVDKYNSLP
jgi:hypothetical protein